MSHSGQLFKSRSPHSSDVRTQRVKARMRPPELKLVPRLSDEEIIDLYELKTNPALRLVNYLSETGAEWNYIVGMPLNFATTFSPAFSEVDNLGITLGWNYLDAIYSVALGIIQLQDKDDYRQTQNKVKGVLNVISGLQTLILSYNPPIAKAMGLDGGMLAAPLAGPAFMLGMACDLVSAAIDLFNSYQEVKLQGWLEQRAKELAYNHERIAKFTEEMKALERAKNNFTRHMYLEAKVRSLKLKIKDIDRDVYARSRVYINAGLEANSAGAATDEAVAARRSEVETILRTHSKQPQETLNQAFTSELTRAASLEDIFTNSKIQKEMQKNYNQERINLALETASFIGMALLAVTGFISCPPLLIIGLTLTTLVAVVYIIRNTEDIASSLQKVSQDGLFGHKKKAREKAENSSFKNDIKLTLVR